MRASWRRTGRAWGIILVIAILAVLPIALNQVGILGVDSYFQYNRIYEAEMQLRHANFSFLNLYSFQQAGRIVNQVYSPLLTVIFGAILLVAGTWFKFQVISMVLVNFIAGISMYYGAKRLKFSFGICVALAGIYLSSFSIYGFVYSTSWRALAVAFVPLLIGSMVDFYRGNWSTREMLALGIIVAIIAQAQIISAALVLPALVPFFVIGLIKTQEKWRALARLGLAILLALLLSLNVVLPYLELLQGSHLLPPTNLPLINGVTNAIVPYSDHSSPLSIAIISLFFYVALATLVLFWRKLSGFARTLTVVSLIYLILGTNVIPWTVIGTQWPALESYLQLPRRFIIAGLSFLLASDVLIVHELHAQQLFHWTQSGIALTVTMLAIAGVSSLAVTSATLVARQSDPNTSIAAGLATNDNNVYAHRYRGKQIKKITDLQPVFHVRDKSALVRVVDRRTPDYVPIKGAYSTKNDYYSAYVRYVIAPKSNFKHQVLPGGVLQLTWRQKKAHQINVPVVVYGNTQVNLNNKALAHTGLKTSLISTPTVQGQKGINRIRLSYQPKMLTLIGIWWSVLAWGVVVIALIWCGWLKHRDIKQSEVD